MGELDRPRFESFFIRWSCTNKFFPNLTCPIVLYARMIILCILKSAIRHRAHYIWITVHMYTLCKLYNSRSALYPFCKRERETEADRWAICRRPFQTFMAGVKIWTQDLHLKLLKAQCFRDIVWQMCSKRRWTTAYNTTHWTAFNQPAICTMF